jgi:hypothetical protein
VFLSDHEFEGAPPIPFRDHWVGGYQNEIHYGVGCPLDESRVWHTKPDLSGWRRRPGWMSGTLPGAEAPGTGGHTQKPMLVDASRMDARTIEHPYFTSPFEK